MERDQNYRGTGGAYGGTRDMVHLKTRPSSRTRPDGTVRTEQYDRNAADDRMRHSDGSAGQLRTRRRDAGGAAQRTGADHSAQKTVQRTRTGRTAQSSTRGARMEQAQSSARGVRTDRASGSAQRVRTGQTARNTQARTRTGQPVRARTRSAADRSAEEQRARAQKIRQAKARRARQLRRRMLTAACLVLAVIAVIGYMGISALRRQNAQSMQQASAESAVSAGAGTGEALKPQDDDAESSDAELSGEEEPQESGMDISDAVERGVSMSDTEVARLVETMERESYPDSLISLFQRNEEARQFVLDYQTKGELHPAIDLSGEVTAGQIPSFFQWDERWGYEFYGEDFLALTGCGPTCLSMVYSGLTGRTDHDPYTIALLADRQGYYVDGSGSSWEIMTRFADTLGLEAEEVAFGEESILEELYEGHPIICAVGAGDFTDGGHFIVLAGLNDDGTVEIRDPNSYLRTNQDWDLDAIMEQTRNLWSFRYDGTAAAGENAY